MLSRLLKLYILSSSFLLVSTTLIPGSAKAFSASDYKSIPSKKIIELNFNTGEVRKYIVNMVNTSKQPLACKMQAYYDIAVIDAQNRGKDSEETNPRLSASTRETLNQLRFQVLDKELRELDKVCQ